MTVQGPVAPPELGRTLVHEHLLIDLRHASFVAPPPELAEIATVPVTALDPALLASHSCSVRDNLLLNDVDVAVAEARRFREAGGGTIVEVTPPDIGRRPELLRAVSERSGLHVVMGCGHYCEIAQGEEVSRRSEDELADEIVRELREGVGETGIRPGIIGEIGVNGEARSSRRRVGEMTATERRVLRGAARAARATGAPMTVHLPSRASAVVSVLDELEAVDAPLGRVSLSHMDTVPDLAVHVEALDRGVWIQYDCFGMALKNDWYEDAGDSRRVEWLIALREQGRLDRVLLSHDVWCKAQLGAYGGEGYSHLLANVAPTLLVRGFDVSDLHQLFVAGPARFLAFTARGELG